jgi:hypothetical protein
MSFRSWWYNRSSTRAQKFFTIESAMNKVNEELRIKISRELTQTHFVTQRNLMNGIDRAIENSFDRVRLQ